MRDAIEHLLARYREIRPLFLVLALPMKEEWKIKPYLGVFPLVFKALHKVHSGTNRLGKCEVGLTGR
jgi:hypothetical protein